MSMYDSVEGIAKRTMVLFFLIDKSYSMGGSKIGAVNYAIRDVIPEVQKIANDSADANIKIAALAFSNGAEWIYPLPVDAQDWQWNDINVEGMTDMGEAFSMLNEKLSRKGGFMSDAGGSYAPVIFLMSDGQPTDEYLKPLAELKNNKWFRASIKAAVAIGDDADKDVLAEFTGNIESVLLARTPEALRRIIRFVTVTTSKIGSTSSNADEDGTGPSKQEGFKEQVKVFTDELEDSEYDDWG